VEPVGDHQLHSRLFGGRDHALALVFGHRHRFFTENMDTGLRGANGKVTVHIVGQCDIHGINGAAA
jgi:hypothetical protein